MQRVLFVDDDVLVRRAAFRLLRSHYDVVTADDGEQALALLRSDDDFAVVVCDLVMPRMTGIALCTVLRAERPHLCERMILMTGQVLEGGHAPDSLSAVGGLLPKPFAGDELLHAIESLIRCRGENRRFARGTAPL
jgi:CheY-like chemotaxis protein